MSRNMTGGNATYSNTTEVLVSGESTSSTDEEIIKDKKNPVRWCREAEEDEDDVVCIQVASLFYGLFMDWMN